LRRSARVAEVRQVVPGEHTEDRRRQLLVAEFVAAAGEKRLTTRAEIFAADASTVLFGEFR
jgi:hypothetical protein